MKVIGFVIGILFLSLNMIQGAQLQENQKEKIIIPDRTTETIKIDGDLNEKTWQNESICKDFFTYLLVYGKPLGHNTRVWLAYDSKNLYFAFKCYDTHPSKLKTSIAARDNIVSDDWVGVAIDTMGNRLSSYEFYVNPNGIQEDGVTSAADVTGVAIMESPMDRAADMVWKSAGKITDEGYQVEMSIPLESIRFKKKKDVKMGIIFKRNVPRLGKTCAWPEVKPGGSEFNAMTTVIYSDLEKSLNLEILPNFTYGRKVERANETEWGESNISNDFGLSFKYGITSSITAEATVNPDFSHVESDMFQFEVNQRYPLFYTEKRPFFMEGMNAFDFGTVYQGNMRSTVYTRRILDPNWAVKVSGTSGKMLFALLAANDRDPELTGDDAYYGVARFKYNIGSDNSVGFIYSGRYLGEVKNNALGADFQYRFLKNARFKMSYLFTGNRGPGLDETQKGSGLTAQVEYLTKGLTAWTTYERYDNDFSMYTSFLDRPNISQGTIFVSPNLYVKSKKWSSWIHKIQPYVRYAYIHDLGTGMNDKILRIGVNLFTAWHGYFKVIYRDEQEAWAGQLFRPKFFYHFFRVQPLKWLYLIFNYSSGPKIHYSIEDPFLGTGYNIGFGSMIQLGTKFNLYFQYIDDTLYKKTNDVKEQVYTDHIWYALTTYQFNKYFFLRGIIQYRNYGKDLITDFLASFTLIPGTVIHLGYGSQYEDLMLQNDEWVPGRARLLNMRNSLFFKVSYLWRIK